MSIITLGRSNAARAEPEPIEPPKQGPQVYSQRAEQPTGQPRTATTIADELDAIDGEAKTIAGRLMRLAIMRRERENELFAVCRARQDQAERIFDEADRVLRHYFGDRAADVQGADQGNPPSEAGVHEVGKDAPTQAAAS